jgi:hypothetical protein
MLAMLVMIGTLIQAAGAHYAGPRQFSRTDLKTWFVALRLLERKQTSVNNGRTLFNRF